VPIAAPLTKEEEREVNYFLHFRRQVHDGPLYTQTRSSTADPSNPKRTYGQDQINQRYGVRSKATQDPFNAVPTYSQRFQTEQRSLPDFSTRRYCPELFPPELRATFEGEDVPPLELKKRKAQNKAQASRKVARRLDEASPGMNGSGSGSGSGAGGQGDVTMQGQDSGVDGKARVLEAVENLADEEPSEDDMEYDEEGVEGEGDEDVEFDDEDAGDYNAEIYFDGGEGDDFGEDGGGEDVY
jgi:DNA-directed RNA polymerase III subunit RPC7